MIIKCDESFDSETLKIQLKKIKWLRITGYTSNPIIKLNLHGSRASAQVKFKEYTIKPYFNQLRDETDTNYTKFDKNPDFLTASIQLPNRRFNHKRYLASLHQKVLNCNTPKLSKDATRSWNENIEKLIRKIQKVPETDQNKETLNLVLRGLNQLKK